MYNQRRNSKPYRSLLLAFVFSPHAVCMRERERERERERQRETERDRERQREREKAQKGVFAGSGRVWQCFIFYWGFYTLN